MNSLDMIHAARSRWRVILATALAIIAIIAIWSFFSPRTYIASATLLFDDSAATANGTPNAPQPAAVTALLGTQADIIRSQAVAMQVVRTLALDQNPDIVARWREQTDGTGSVATWLTQILQANVTVAPTRNTSVMAVQYQANDPDFAALMANGFADAFVLTQLRLKTEPAKVYSDWFADRTRDVRRRYEETQARMTEFQRAKGLIGGEKLDLELGHLSELSTQLATAEGAAADMRARAGGASSQSPEVQSSPAVLALRSAVAAKTADVQRLASTIGSGHPQLITERAVLASLNARLAEAVGTSTRALKVASSSASLRESELRQLLAQQREKVLKLQGAQDQLAVLQRDVDAAKLSYDSVTQNLNGARLKAELPQTSVSVLDRADVPFYPASPNLGLRAILGLLLGVGTGLGLALFLEWRAPRVRTTTGIDEATGLTTLVELDSYRRQKPISSGRMSA